MHSCQQTWHIMQNITQRWQRAHPRFQFSLFRPDVRYSLTKLETHASWSWSLLDTGLTCWRPKAPGVGTRCVVLTWKRGCIDATCNGDNGDNDSDDDDDDDAAGGD